MDKNNLRLIKGGLESVSKKETAYIYGYVTDTRLMGVVCMYVHWYLPDQDNDLHQFFYFDCEEYGFESYKSIMGNDAMGIAVIESKIIGGLGGNKVEISKVEAEALLGEYVHFNNKRNIPLPGDKSEYEFMLREDFEIGSDEKKILFAKQCGEIKSKYQAINYFLMRCFGGDYQGARYVSTNKTGVHIFDKFAGSTFHKNTIDETEDSNVFMCESIIEKGNAFRLVTSEISMWGNKVAGAKLISEIRLSFPEMSLIMSKPEYITVYDISDAAVVDDLLKRYVMGAGVQEHLSGTCYLVYHRDNEHVGRRVFWLNEDVYGIYFVSVYNQLIACSYHLDYIEQMEIELAVSEIGEHIDMVSRYEFKNPVLYDYIRGDFEDFEDFIEFMNGDFED